VLTCCGDGGAITYKKTREDESLTNKITTHYLNHSEEEFTEIPFDPIGSDERQYASPGFNLPVGVVMRTSFGQYKEYHTSYDNKELMDFKKMSELIHFCTGLVKAYELNDNYVNQVRYGEPFLKKRDMFEDLSTKLSHSDLIKMRLRLLNYLDGTNDLVDICDTYGYSIFDTEAEIKQLLEHGLIK
jgi:aminopeptidase-like protein